MFSPSRIISPPSTLEPSSNFIIFSDLISEKKFLIPSISFFLSSIMPETIILFSITNAISLEKI